MKISIKKEEQIQKMRIAGKLASEVLEMIEPFVVPGISTGELDQKCYDYIVNVQNAIPANVGYRGFEKTICSSINQVICHGIPDNNRILKEGDILNIDVTVIKDGWHGDTSKMYLVGKCKPHNERLVKVTQECLYKAIEVVKPGAYLGDIGHVIQKHAESNYYSVVEDYCGHGIGDVYHMINITNSMATVVFNYTVIVRFSMFLNNMTYIAKIGTRLHNFYSLIQTFLRNLNKSLIMRFTFTHKIHF